MKSYLSYELISLKDDLAIEPKPLIKNKLTLDKRRWSFFDYDTKKTNSIFKIKKGKRLKESDHIVGDIPYVSSSSLNNGIDNLISNGFTSGIRSTQEGSNLLLSATSAPSRSACPEMDAARK